MANKISLVFEAIGADKLAQVFGQVSGAAEKAGASAEKASQGTQAAGQAAGTATKNVDLLGLSLNKMSGLAGQAGVDLGVFRQAVQGAHESMSMLAGGFSAGTAAAGAFVVGIAGITGALVATSQHLVSSYNEIKTFAAVSGMAAGDADDLADAMQAVGVSSQQLSMALFKLEDDATSGGEALLKLGLTMDELKTKSSGELFVATIDKIQALGSQSEKTAALVEVFGARLGRAFAELVREGGMSIDQLKAKVADLSPWTKEMETNARNLAVAQTFLSNAIGGVVDMLGNAFAPILTSAINTMTEWAVAIRKGIENSGVLGTSINMLVSVFGALWEAIQPLMPLLIELGKAAVAVGLAMITGFQGVMIPVVALTGALGALWASLQKVLAGDFSGALTALTTGLAKTEEATQRQIARFNEQVAANEKVAASLNGVTTATTATGAAAERTAPTIRKVGDEMTKAGATAKASADALTQWVKAVGQVGITAAIIADDVEKLRSALEFEDLEATILGDLATEMSRLRDESKEAVQALQDAAKYMQGLGEAAGAATVPLENLRQYVGDLEPAAASAAEAMAILTDRVERLIPPNTIESITQYGDALRQAGVTAASSATTFDILNDSISEAGAASLESEQRWEAFGTTLRGSFLSVTDTFSKMATGLIQGTLSIDDAFKNLGQSLLTNFTQMVMHEVFDPILEEAASFVGQLIQTFLSADWGSVAASWGQAIAGIFSSVFGGGGGGSTSLGGDWWDEFDFEALAHGGRITRSGPFILHQGETVVPAGYHGGTSSGFSTLSARGSGPIPVYVQNFNEGASAFGRAFDYGKMALGIGTRAYDFIAPFVGTQTSKQFALSVGKDVVSYVGGWFGRGPVAAGVGPGSTLLPPTAAELAPSMTGLTGPPSGLGIGAPILSGIGSILSILGGVTKTPALGYAGMGIQGAVMATQILSSLVPAIGSAVATGVSAVGSLIAPAISAIGAGVTAIAPGVASAIGSMASSLAPVFGALGAAGPAMGVFAVPAVASFLATMGMEEQTRQDIVRHGSGQVYGGDMAARAGTIQTIADLDKKYIDQVFGERTPRQDVTMLATWASTFAEQGRQQILTMEGMAKDMGANFDESIAFEKEGMDRLNAFVSKAAEIGVRPDMALLNVAPRTVSPGHGVQTPENFGPLMDVWTEIINRITSGTQAVADGSQDVADAADQQSTATKSVVQNQADLIMKYGDTTERLRLIGEAFDVDLGIPKLMELTKGQLDFLGTATGEQIEGLIAGWRETLTTAVTDQVMADPVKLASILDMEKLKQGDETVEQTFDRVATSLLELGALMDGLAVEALALTDPFAAATLGFQQTIDAVEGADWAGLVEGLKSADPTDWVDAATQAHDLLLARYQAEVALIQAINESIGSLYAGANALVGTASRLQDLGIMPKGAMEFAGLATEFGTQAVGAFGTPQQNVIAGGGAVGLFAAQSMMAAKAMDLPGLESAMRSAGNLVAGFTATIDQINQIEDPAERMRLLTEVLGQVGAASEAAAQAAITYWQTLHDTVAGMMAQINGIASSIADAGNAIARNAGWLQDAGVDIGHLTRSMAGLINLFPTMAGKLTALSSTINLFLSSFDKTAFEGIDQLLAPKGKFDEIGEKVADIFDPDKMFYGHLAGVKPTMDPKTWGKDLHDLLDPVFKDFVTRYEEAMTKTEPTERLEALTSIFTDIQALLASLPPEFAATLTKTFAPQLQLLSTSMRGSLSESIQPVLKGFYDTFLAAMQLQDPGERMAALTGIMDNIGVLLASLPPGMAEALISQFGPEMKILIAEIEKAAKEQAARAVKINEELKAIIGDKALSPENFLLMTVAGIKDSLALIVTAGGPLFEKIATSMVTAGGDISAAIKVAGDALSGALGGFETPAKQLTAALNSLAADIGREVANAVKNAIPKGQSGIDAVPRTGIYLLHEGEGVLTAQQNAAMKHGVLGSYAVGTAPANTSVRDVMNAVLQVERDLNTLSRSASTAWERITTAWQKATAAWDIATQAYGKLVTTMTAAWNALPAKIETAVRRVIASLTSAQSGLGAVPQTGLYLLHKDEGVLTAEQNAAFHRGVLGSFQKGTFDPTRPDPRLGPPPPVQPGYGPEWQAYMDAQNAKIEADRKAANAAAMAASGAESLTDAIDRLQSSILGAADALINSADLTGANLQGVAYALAGWSMVLTDVDAKASTFVAGMRAWSVQIARTNDVMTELVGGGRLALDVIQSMVAAAKGLSDADPGAKLDSLTTAYNAIVQGAEATQDAVRRSYDRQRAAIQNSVEAIDDQVSAIDDQIRGLEDLRQATEAWGSVAESVADMLLDLRLSDLAPPDAMGQLNLAQSEFAKAMASFRAAPTPEGAGQVQELARSVLDAATNVFTRPSPEYQALFESITSSLEEIGGVAAARSQGDVLEEIAALETRREALDIQRNNLQAQTRAAIENLNTQEQAALAAIQSTVGPELAILAMEMERVAILAAQQATATGQSSAQNVLDASYRVLTSMDGSTQIVVDRLGQIVGILSGGKFVPVAPGRGAEFQVTPDVNLNPPGTRFAQGGAWHTEPGLYELHAGEMVLPASVASTVRAGGGGGGGGVTFNFDQVTVTGTREGAREFFKELEVLTERSMRFGTLNRVLKSETKGR